MAANGAPGPLIPEENVFPFEQCNVVQESGVTHAALNGSLKVIVDPFGEIVDVDFYIRKENDELVAEGSLNADEDGIEIEVEENIFVLHLIGSMYIGQVLRECKATLKFTSAFFEAAVNKLNELAHAQHIHELIVLLPVAAPNGNANP